MRFKYRSHSQNIYDSETGRIYTGGKAICELLNELNNELNTYDAGNQLLKRSFDECRKENEQLKHSIKDAYETERTSLGKSVLKQLIEGLE